MNNITYFIALILYLCIIGNESLTRNHLFVEQTKNLNCHTLIKETITSPTVGGGSAYCTVSCVQAATDICSCIGWAHETGACHMCYKCSGNGTTTSLNATWIPYDPTTEADLYQSCDDKATGLPNINAPLYATGTNVIGKKNNAIKLIGGGQTLHILPPPTTLCRNSLTACNNGVTFAFWLKISNNTGWNTMTQPFFFLRTNCLSLKYFNGILQVVLGNHATGIGKVQNMTMRFNEWVHYGITWDNPSNVMTVYENGALHGTGGDVQGTIPRTSYYFQGTSEYDFAVDEYYTFEKVMDTPTILLLASE